MKKRILLLFMLALLLTGTLSIYSWAASDTPTASEKGVNATIKTDKKSYKAGEKINITVTIENTGKIDVSNVKLRYNFADGMSEVKKSDFVATADAIESGKTLTIKGQLVGDKDVYGSGMQGILLIAGIAAAAVVVIAIIVILVLKKKKNKKSSPMMMLLLLLALTGLCVTSVEAASTRIMFKLTKTVTYAGKSVSLKVNADVYTSPKTTKLESDQYVTYKQVSVHDPSIIKANDGAYYIFGSHLLAAKTTDLMNWATIANSTSSYSSANKLFDNYLNQFKIGGAWAGTSGNLWAPDVIYNKAMGKYCMYMSVDGDMWKSSIALLTADNIEGPYTYVDTIVYSGFTTSTYQNTDLSKALGGITSMPDRYNKIGATAEKSTWGSYWPNAIDPCVFYDADGTLWMSYGSWSGGIFMLKLDGQTGLRDYTSTYSEAADSDPYFGKKIAGGWYVSGEGSYIEKVGNYYFLFVSYGGLESNGGYNIRLFRSENPTGPYVDAAGKSAVYSAWIDDINGSVGVKMMGNYQWSIMTRGEVAQGHNSAIVDDDGRVYLVYHTRFSTGGEGHQVRVHQMFLNEDGWLVTAPYEFSGEKISDTGYEKDDIVGSYEFILHKLNIGFASKEVVTPQYIELNEDGTVSGDATGTWTMVDGKPYMSIKVDNVEYKGVFLKQSLESTKVETITFTAVGNNNVTVWGSKTLDTETK